MKTESSQSSALYPIIYQKILPIRRRFHRKPFDQGILLQSFPSNIQRTCTMRKTHMHACERVGVSKSKTKMKGSTSHNEHCLGTVCAWACACHSSTPHRMNWYGTHIVECNTITVFKWSSRVHCTHSLHFGRCAPFTSGSISLAHSTASSHTLRSSSLVLSLSPCITIHLSAAA